MRSFLLYGAAIVAIGVLIVLLAGGKTEISATATCTEEPFVRGDEPLSPAASLFLVDFSNNDERAREAVVHALRPAIAAAIRDGGTVRLVVSGGEGEPVQVSPCLDGQTLLHSDWHNETRERQEQGRATELIEKNVWALLAETEVAPVGSTTDLIAEIPNQLRGLRIPPSTAAGRAVRVTLISDLSSPAAKGDCLTLDGAAATQVHANAIVERCLELREFRPLPATVELAVVQPRLTRGNGIATRMGRFLAAALCAQLTTESKGCVAPSEPGG